MITAAVSLACFLLLTLVYFVCRYYIVDRKFPPTTTGGDNQTIIGLLYLALAITTQLVINIKNTTELCKGSPQVGTAVIYTLLPNFFMFGLILMLLSILPGWKEPFSNTIGYLVVKLQGVATTFSELLASKGSKLIDKICEDHAIIINQITPDNFTTFLKKMAKDGLLEHNWEGSSAETTLWQYVAIKNLIAEALWYILTGMLVISTTYNALLNIVCDISTQQRNAMTKKFEADQAAEAKKPEPKYFTIHD